jgi:3-oxoacid CoA-transferase subunit B
VHCVKKIVTDLAVLDITDQGFRLLERAPGVSIEEIKQKTKGRLIIEGEIPEVRID